MTMSSDEKTAVGYTSLSQDFDLSITNQEQQMCEYAYEYNMDLLCIYDDGEWVPISELLEWTRP